MSLTKLKVGEKEIFYDNFLLEILKLMKTAVKKDMDNVFIVDGAEGTGKSVIAQQLGAYLDPTLCIERICFTGEDFIKACISANKNECVILDEGFVINARATMSSLNKSVASMLAEIRQKCLHIIVVLPSIFDLDRYIALWRAKGLIHVYMGKNFQRGNFKFYDHTKIKDLVLMGKKFYSYNVTKPSFPPGRFMKGYYVNEEEYRNKKLEALKGHMEKEESRETKWKAKMGEYLELRARKEGLSKLREESLMLGHSDNYLGRILRETRKLTQTGDGFTFKPTKNSGISANNPPILQ